MIICSRCGRPVDYISDVDTRSNILCSTCYNSICEVIEKQYYDGFSASRHEAHKTLLDKIHETYINKNAAYGNSFDQSIDRYGYVAALVRMEDKMNRLEQLLLHNATPNDEVAEDTALDLANYAIMVAMKLLDKKGENK